MLYWVLKKLLIGPILNLLFRPWVEGGENIPKTGGAIFASNHLSFSDSFFLPLMVPRRMTFVAKADYFEGKGLKGRLTAAFFKGVGQIPIDRSGGSAAEGAMRSGLRVLQHGELFGIYPEGTRSPDGRLYKGKTGMARLALQAKVPIIPVAMVGTDKAQPAGKVIPNITRVGMRIGEPMDFSRYEGMENDRFVLRSITDEVMYELMLLSGQEYVDVYASTVKDRLAGRLKTVGEAAASVGGAAVSAGGAAVSSAAAGAAALASSAKDKVTKRDHRASEPSEEDSGTVPDHSADQPKDETADQHVTGSEPNDTAS